MDIHVGDSEGAVVAGSSVNKLSFRGLTRLTCPDWRWPGVLKLQWLAMVEAERLLCSRGLADDVVRCIMKQTWSEPCTGWRSDWHAVGTPHWVLETLKPFDRLVRQRASRQGSLFELNGVGPFHWEEVHRYLKQQRLVAMNRFAPIPVLQK